MSESEELVAVGNGGAGVVVEGEGGGVQLVVSALNTAEEVVGKVDEVKEGKVEDPEKEGKEGEEGKELVVSPSPQQQPQQQELDEEEKQLLRRLEQKRREVDEEIEAFKAKKEEEYAAFEKRLRRRKVALLERRKREKQAGGGISSGGSRTVESGSGSGSGSGEDEDVGSSSTDGKAKRGYFGILNDAELSPTSSLSSLHNKKKQADEEEDDELPFAISSPEGLMALNAAQEEEESLKGVDESGPLTVIGTAPAAAAVIIPDGSSSQPPSSPSLTGTVIPAATSDADVVVIPAAQQAAKLTTSEVQPPAAAAATAITTTVIPTTFEATSTSTTTSSSSPSTTTSPPYDEGLQAAGLFTPRYLPLLLDDTFPRGSFTRQVVAVATPIDSDTNTTTAAAAATSTTTPTTTAATATSTSTPARPTTPIRTSVPISTSGSSTSSSPGGTNHHRRATSPGAPLASSLKNSASSGFSSSAASARNLKLKSPKRVSFKLDETKAVPSRSTPPQTILTFQPDEEEPETIDIEQLESLDDITGVQGSSSSSNNSKRKKSSSESAGVTVTGRGSSSSKAMPKSVIVDRMSESPASLISQALVTPLTTGVMDDGSIRYPSGAAARLGRPMGNNVTAIGGHDHDDWEAVDRPNGSHDDEDDDEEDLFDMDETIPLSPDDLMADSVTVPATSTAARPMVDFDSESMWAGVTAPTNIIATPHGLREVGSLPKYSPVSASVGAQGSKLPGNFPLGRRGSVPFSFGNLEEVGAGGGVYGGVAVAVGGVAASLPVYNGFEKENGIKRRSVRKYYPEEPDAPPQRRDWKGKGKGSGMLGGDGDGGGGGGGGNGRYEDDLLEEEEEETIPESTFGSSVPITIYRPEKAAAAAKPKTQTVQEEDGEGVDPTERQGGGGVDGAVHDGSASDDDEQSGLEDEQNYSRSPPDMFFADGDDGLAGGLARSGSISPTQDNDIFQTDEDHEVMSSTPTVKHRPVSISVQPPQPQQHHTVIGSLSVSPGNTASGGNYSVSPFSGMPPPPVPPSQQQQPRASLKNIHSAPAAVLATSSSSPPSSRPPPGMKHFSNPHIPPHHHQQQLLNPFSASPSPYKTSFAARIAAEAESSEDPDGIGSVVGGVDGRTGLDPYVLGNGNGGRRASVAGGLGAGSGLGALSGIGAGMGSLRLRAATGGSYLAPSGFAGSWKMGGGAAGGGGGGGGVGGDGAGGMAIRSGGGGRGKEGEEVLELRPETMSFSMRLALEEHMEKAGRVGVKGRG